MTYAEAMEALADAAQAAVTAADSEDGAPVNALRDIAAEVDHLIDHNCTRAELADAQALYLGMKQAGMTP
jgi:hypothetical protein